MAKIRKIIVVVDEIHSEQGQPINPPTRRAAAIAIIANPLAGKFEKNLDALIDIGEELGGLLGERAVAALGVAPSQIEILLELLEFRNKIIVPEDPPPGTGLKTEIEYTPGVTISEAAIVACS